MRSLRQRRACWYVHDRRRFREAREVVDRSRRDARRAASSGVRRAFVSAWPFGFALVFAPSGVSAQGLFPIWQAAGACFQESMQLRRRRGNGGSISKVSSMPRRFSRQHWQCSSSVLQLARRGRGHATHRLLAHQPGPFHYDGSGIGVGGPGAEVCPAGKDCLRRLVRSALYHRIHTLGGRQNDSSARASQHRHRAHADRDCRQRGLRDSVGEWTSSVDPAAAANLRRARLDARRNLAAGLWTGIRLIRRAKSA